MRRLSAQLTTKMQINDSIFSFEEKAELKIRELFETSGFTRFKMARFEEYDLYAKNRNFLPTNKIITFTDTDGRLLALKPDVTMSIIRHMGGEAKGQVYYAENVYRESKRKNGFCEIRQVGAECIGDVENSVQLMATLAAKSLSLIDSEFVLGISHLGLVKGLFKAANLPIEIYETALDFVCSKNKSALDKLLKENSVKDDDIRLIGALIDVFGKIGEAVKKLETLVKNEEIKQAVEELKRVSKTAEEAGFADKVFLDFSVIGNINYYDGIVFRGFINGVPDGVLYGGEYSALAKRIGNDSKAVGFVVYLNELENKK